MHKHLCDDDRSISRHHWCREYVSVVVVQIQPTLVLNLLQIHVFGVVVAVARVGSTAEADHHSRQWTGRSPLLLHVFQHHSDAWRNRKERVDSGGTSNHLAGYLATAESRILYRNIMFVGQKNILTRIT